MNGQPQKMVAPDWGSGQQRSSLPPQGWQVLIVEFASGRQRVSGAVQVSLQQGWLTPPQVPSPQDPATQFPERLWQLVPLARHTPSTQQASRQLLAAQQGCPSVPQD